jgi:uncharacterized membrane protein
MVDVALTIDMMHTIIPFVFIGAIRLVVGVPIVIFALGEAFSAFVAFHCCVPF